MAVETTFQDLVGRLRALRETISNLLITAVEDRPLTGAVLLVERVGNTVDDLRGLAEEALAAAEESAKAVGHPLDEYHARSSLAAAHRHFISLEYKFFVEALSCDGLNELATVGRQHGREWRGWASSMFQALMQCRDPLRQVDDALLSAWQDLSERVAAGGVSVRTTTIGQISAPLGQVRGQEASVAGDEQARRQRV